MTVASKEHYFQAGSALAVSAVVRFYLATMHRHDVTAEIQAYACTIDMQFAGVLALVKSVEELVGLRLFEANATVSDLQYHHVVVCTYTDRNLSSVKGVFEGIGQEIGDDLVEHHTVYPYFDGLVVHVKGFAVAVRQPERYIAILRTILIYADAMGSEVYEVGLLTMKLHLSLVYLPLIENLVDKHQESLCIVIDSLNIALALTIGDPASQLLQGPHDKGQRRPDIVCGIDEESHLLLFNIGAATTLVLTIEKEDDDNNDRQVDGVGPYRSIPRRLYVDMYLCINVDSSDALPFSDALTSMR